MYGADYSAISFPLHTRMSAQMPHVGAEPQKNDCPSFLLDEATPKRPESSNLKRR